MIFQRYTFSDSLTNGYVEESLVSKQHTKQFNFKDYYYNYTTDENEQDEYNELKYKHENAKKINEKIYNFAIEKILNSS